MTNGYVVPILGRILAGLALSSALLSAQAIDSNLVGAVTDSTGAAIPRAAIRATNQSTAVQYAASTDGSGQYRLDHLPAGTYDVTAGAPDFATQTTANLILQLNHTGTANFELRVASQATSVQVVNAAPPLDTATAQLQTSFASRAFIDIPFSSGSGYLNLSLLAPGVASPGGVGLGYGPSVGGQRATNNRFYIDGVDHTSYFVPGPLTYISNEALSEFTILQNQFSSEFGGASGGLFNAIIKSGGNQVHGSLYEYMQNRNLKALDAATVRQLQAAKAPLSTPRYDNNRLGATIGGPILKNKLFYFGNFEYSPTGNSSPGSTTVSAPTASGYQILDGLSGISKTNLQVLQKYVLPAQSASGSVFVRNTSIPVGAIPVIAPSYQNAYAGMGSVDWNISDRDQLRGRYIDFRSSGIFTQGALPAFFVTIPSNSHLISLSEFHTFSASTQNELRIGYSRNNNRRTAADLSFPGLDAFPTITFRDLALQLGPGPTVPNGQIQGDFQATDGWTHNMGRHTIKAGYEFHDIILNTSFVSNPRGSYNYTNLETYLTDLAPDLNSTRFIGTTGPVVNGMPAGFLQNGAYFNDDFRIRPNLTLNLGVRYEYVTVPVMSRAQQYSAIANVPGVITFAEPQPSKTDWSPRVGFAYSPGKSNLWSIRAGFSRAFDMPYANIATNTVPEFYGTSQTAPSTGTNFLANGGLTTPPPLLSSVVFARAFASGYTPDQNRPYSINYTVAVQRLLGKDYTLEARYLGSRGIHLYVQEQLNRTSAVTAAQSIPTYLDTPSAAKLAASPLTLGALKAIPNNPLAPYGFSSPITAYEPMSRSQYHALALQMTKRYSKKFSYVAAYTWSHLMDDSTATVFTTLLSPRRPQDFNNLHAEWGSSMLDRRHRLSITPIYDFTPFRNGNWITKNIVGNWSVSLTYIYESPAYATVQSSVDSNLNGDTVGDRAIVNPIGIANVGSDVNPYDRNGNVVAVGSASIVAYVAKNPNARYIAAGQGAYANGGRNTFPLDPINNIDFSLRKRFSIGEQRQLEFAGQAFNLFNHPQFTGGYTNDVAPLNTSTSSLNNFLIPSNPLFGQYQQFLNSNSRVVQIVGRFTF